MATIKPIEWVDLFESEYGFEYCVNEGEIEFSDYMVQHVRLTTADLANMLKEIFDHEKKTNGNIQTTA